MEFKLGGYWLVPFLLDSMKAAMKSWGFPGTRQGPDTSIYGRRGGAKRKGKRGDFYIGVCLRGNDGNYTKKTTVSSAKGKKNQLKPILYFASQLLSLMYRDVL